VEDFVSDPWAGLARTRMRPWSFWKFNWIVNHQILAALRRVRGYARGTLVDVGCGEKAFAHGLGESVTRYVGVDLPSSSYPIRPDLFARGERLPFRDASADTVLGLSIMTYVPEPLRLLEEARRILRPDGHLVMEFPQMAALNDEPDDYFRFTRYGAAWLLGRAGFEVVEVVTVGGLWTAVALQILAVLNRWNRGPWRVLTELPVRLLYVVVQLVCAALDRWFFAPRWVLAHLVVARVAARPQSARDAGR
jgi:SAM-dependent methyltransferase